MKMKTSMRNPLNKKWTHSIDKLQIYWSKKKKKKGKGGFRVVQWCWVNFQCRSVLLISIIVWQGLTALAVGAGGGGLDIFSFSSSFSLSLGDGPT